MVRQVDTHDLFFHLRNLTLKDFHIEAYKILKKSKQNNADNIFNLLKITGVANPDKTKVISICLDALDTHHATITEICAIRDKYYAHPDVDYEKYLLTGTLLTDIDQVFIAIERAIAVVASPEMLQSYLDKIPSRDDLTFWQICTTAPPS